MARAIVLDSKLRQMAVCNGLETLLVPRERGAQRAAVRAEGAARAGRRDSRLRANARGVRAKPCRQKRRTGPPSTSQRSSRCASCDDLDAAIAHIQRYGTDHTEVIVTSDYANAQAWLRRVNSSTVGVNCSTAFADGYRLGLGAEIGISHLEAARLRADGPRRADDAEVRAVRGRPAPRMSGCGDMLIAGAASRGGPGAAPRNGSLGPWWKRRHRRLAALHRVSGEHFRGASLRLICAPQPPARRETLLGVGSSLHGEWGGRRQRGAEPRRRRCAQLCSRARRGVRAARFRISR